MLHPVLPALKAPWRIVLPCAVVALVLALFPQIDLGVSAWFYDAQHGFTLGTHPLIDAVGKVTGVASAIFVLGVAGLWAWCRFNWPPVPMWLRRFCVTDRMFAYLFLAFIIGPLLIVGFALKENWGRMRPAEISQFGGAGVFTPYYQPSRQCDTDCSFSSGHSARGFYFLALAIVAYRFGWRHRHAILGGALAFGVLTAVLRVVEGKHFLSDVTFSAFITGYVAWVLCGLLFGHKAKAETAAAASADTQRREPSRAAPE